jgi:hypothetical protein
MRRCHRFLLPVSCLGRLPVIFGQCRQRAFIAASRHFRFVRDITWRHITPDDDRYRHALWFYPHIFDGTRTKVGVNCRLTVHGHAWTVNRQLTPTYELLLKPTVTDVQDFVSAQNDNIMHQIVLAKSRQVTASHRVQLFQLLKHWCIAWWACCTSLHDWLHIKYHSFIPCTTLNVTLSRARFNSWKINQLSGAKHTKF